MKRSKQQIFDMKQTEKQLFLVQNEWVEKDAPQNKRDLFNLKLMRCSIKYGSLFYRIGCISTLDRIINQIEVSK